jgi:hypothetical protein
MISGGVSLDTVARSFKRHRFAFLPSLISTEMACRFEQKTRNLPFTRVSVGDNPATWDEHTLASDCEIVAMFSSAQVIQLISNITGLNSSVRDLICWIARYRNSEYIDRHTDSAGTIQLLLCLAAPPAENGGALVLLSGPSERCYVLRTGDAVLFTATTVEHCTTPLMPSSTCPDPARVVAVARYFFP